MRSWISASPEEIVGELLCERYPVNVADGFFERYKTVVETRESVTRVVPIDDRGIGATWLRQIVVPLDDGVAITTTNISDLIASDARLAQLGNFAAAVFASSPFATIVTDLEGTIRSVNPAAEKMLLRESDALVGAQLPLALLDPRAVEQRAGVLAEELGAPIEPGIDTLRAKPMRRMIEEAEWKFERGDGMTIDAQLTVSALLDSDDEVDGLIMIAYDITERKRIEHEVAHVALHDALTGLPTRTLLVDRLKTALLRTQRTGRRVGVLVVDLDDFKRVNDVLGHHAGDELLRHAGAIMKRTVRSTDTVGRIGGDEFVIVLDDIDDIGGAERIAAKVLHAFSEPVGVGPRQLPVPASIGIAVSPDHGMTAEEIVRSADTAMYRAKSAGGNRSRTFDEELAVASSRRRQLESALAGALARNEFALVYQPQISVRSGAVVGVEALLRWHSPQLGTVMPAEFIPILEDNGLIVPVGDWVVRRACEAGKRIHAEVGRPLTVAVNVSPRQFEREDFAQVIGTALTAAALDPSALEIEITENLLLGESPQALDVLERIRTLGVRVALDDFGTGFCSMSYLMRFPVDRLKIDRSFVDALGSDANSHIVVRSIIALANGLKIRVVAEGVENAAHRDFLQREGCADAQGYFFAQPVTIDELAAMIRSVEPAA